MKKKPLYTIGYSNREPNEFIGLLKKLEIDYLVDIRSQPYSKFNQTYNQDNLSLFLTQNGITYVFMGDTLGGRPKDTSCYNEKGKVDYEIIKTKDFFQNGIERLKTAYHKNIGLVLMCYESKPCECHRSKLIGKALALEHIDLVHLEHIGDKEVHKDQETVMHEVYAGLSQIDLFGETDQNKTNSRKTYL